MDGGSLRLRFVVMHHRRAMIAIHRWLPEHHSDYQAPLSAPVEVHHAHRLNFYLGIVLVVFMAVSVVALVCCCYHLEWRLRLQARNAAWRVNRTNGILGQNAGPREMIEKKVTKQVLNLEPFLEFMNSSHWRMSW
jgi:hypothetical protein